MSAQFPVVSVIIPAYNAEVFIGLTLDSVLSQTYTDIEVLVVDDGSQDRTAEIVESYAQRDARIILLQQRNSGVAAARNFAIQKSKGEYIAPIDADDIWYPQKLEKQVQCMLEAEPTVGLVYAWSSYIDENGLLMSEGIGNSLQGWVHTALVYTNFVDNASVPLIRRTCFEQVGDYNCELKKQNAQGCEDWDLYLRIAECYQFRVVPEVLIGYRQVTGSMACNFTSMTKSYYIVMEDVRQRHPEISTAIFRWSKSSFYAYLSRRTRASGAYWSTLFWLYKALQVDFVLLLSFDIYKIFVISLLKIVARPVTSLVWKDHRSWLQFKQRFKSNHRVITSSESNGQINEYQRLSQNLYDRIVLKRLYRAIENSLPSSTEG